MRFRAPEPTAAGLADPAPPRSPAWSASPRPAQAATSATATYAKSQDWGTGFEGKWTVKNTGTTTLSSWTVEWDFPSGTVRHLRLGRRRHQLRHPLDRQEQVAGTAPSPPAPPSASASTAPAPAPPPTASSTAAAATAAPRPRRQRRPPPPAPRPPRDVTDTSVKLSWSAATDDKGIKNYDVLRGGTKVATVTGTTLHRHRPDRRHRLLVHRPGPRHRRPDRPGQRRRPRCAPPAAPTDPGPRRARSSSATSPSGASTAATTTSRTW